VVHIKSRNPSKFQGTKPLKSTVWIQRISGSIVIFQHCFVLFAWATDEKNVKKNTDTETSSVLLGLAGPLHSKI